MLIKQVMNEHTDTITEKDVTKHVRMRNKQTTLKKELHEMMEHLTKTAKETDIKESAQDRCRRTFYV